jgi:hypothetical protein
MAGEPPTQEPRGLIHPKLIWDSVVWVAKKVRDVFDDADDIKKILDGGGRSCPNPDCDETDNSDDAQYCKKCGWRLDAA